MNSMWVKDSSPFPVPLDGYFQRWSKDGTLKNRLRSALALAMETEGAGVVLIDSVLDNVIKGMLNEIFSIAKRRYEK